MISMKTPDVIKKGLAMCSADECHGQHTDCPYHPELMCIRNICRDALALIQQLQAELSDAKNNHQHTIDIAERQKSQIDKLKKVIVRLNAERDAAVEACGKFPCESCVESENGDNCNWCAVVNGRRTGYVWRGVKENA